MPLLWILVPTASPEFRRGLGARKRQNISGVYDFPEIYRGGLIVIHQLPRNEETLWLRMLGRGRVQQQAISEFTALPETHPLRENIEELLGNWRTNLESKNRLTNEEEELIVNLSPAYLQRREEWKREGATEERRIVIENLISARFGETDAQLLSVVNSLLSLSTEEFSGVILQLAQLSREELIERFGQE